MYSIPNQTQIQTKGEITLNKSESITNLVKALSQFQAEVQNPKNTADNPFFKSKYAPLNDVLNLVRPLLSKHGLSVLQSPSGDGENIIISSILMHSTGEWIEPDPLVLRADKPTAQGAGSAITYGRRYSISAILGISSEDDDDGNHAEGKPKGQVQPKQAQPKQQKAGTISEAQAKRMFAIAGNPKLVQDLLTAKGYAKSTDVKVSEYEAICKELEKGASK